MKIAAIGFSCVDVYETGQHYATGNGIDCIINLAKRGVEGAAVTAVGDDAYGKEMLEVLGQYGINTEHVQVNPGATSIYRMALKNGNDRVHLENIPGVMANYAPTEEDIAFTAAHDFIHTDLTGRVLHRLQDLKAKGGKLVLDFSIVKEPKVLDEVLPQVDYAFFSCDMPAPGVEEFLKAAHSRGPALVVGTMGSEGSMCYDGARFYRQGITQVPVLNTVGAGDSFIAGFTFGLMQGWDIPACLASGNDFATEVVQLFNPY